MINDKRLLKLAEAADYCGLPRRNFRKRICVPPVRLGPHELWDRTKLDAYLDALQGAKEALAAIDWSDAIKRF